MKKRILAVFTIYMLVVALGLPMSVLAAEDHGGEAHSPSMSVESGEEPIADMSTTEDTGRVDAGEVLDEPAEEATEENVEEQPVQDVEETKEIAKQSIWIAAVAIIGVGSVIVEILVTKSRRKKNGGKSERKADRHYKGKH